MSKFVIEAIQKDYPYFSFGYVKSFDGRKIEWTSNLKEALQTSLEELEECARFIPVHYNGVEYVRLMPWFYEVINGKQAKERTFFKDFK